LPPKDEARVEKSLSESNNLAYYPKVKHRFYNAGHRLFLQLQVAFATTEA
jgi:hypothetical protein